MDGCRESVVSPVNEMPVHHLEVKDSQMMSGHAAAEFVNSPAQNHCVGTT